MSPDVIKEARRLIRDLIFFGRAQTTGGRIIVPKDEVMVTMLEKVASKKVEEPDVPLTIEGYLPKETYREVNREVCQDTAGEGSPQAKG